MSGGVGRDVDELRLSESFMAKVEVATPQLQGSSNTDTLNSSIIPHVYVHTCNGLTKVSLTHSALPTYDVLVPLYINPKIRLPGIVEGRAR